MNKLFAVFALALLVSGAASNRVSPCPIQSNIGSLISGTSHNPARITVAQQLSLVTLVQGTDTQCYNYALPYAFATVPEVAVGNPPS